MRSDLTELKDRLAVADEEIGALEARIDAFTRAEVHQHVRPHISQPFAFDVVASLKRPVPAAATARAGMIANEVRSVLDGLASVLAVRNNQDPKNVYFPISKSKAIFEDDGMRKIKKLSAADQALIVSLRPYREENRLLFGLHEADRTRKHQRLSFCAAGNANATIPGLATAVGGGQIHFENVTFNGVHTQSMTLGGSVDSLDMPVGREIVVASGVPFGLDVRFEYTVVYSEPEELAGQPVVKTLRWFALEAQKIVSMFD
ncbi:hypothetical protein EJC49_24710 [Aquibium carbonis]|uniref:Uncharacterized protein n=1 Tax=Aquibium carbonis TaxID=2495581 RepID=A0A3R9Y0D2_9HYPH|nr:hypothetical protein [Aquibium carbonis]RST80100.1 hypothetical protein EJC49_24710 [Aquibium carbonis]